MRPELIFLHVIDKQIVKRHTALRPCGVFAMIETMKYILLSVALFSLAVSAEAFSPIVTETEEPYEIITIENEPAKPAYYLGELQNYPVMYEVTSEESFLLNIKISQLMTSGELTPFSLITIRKNDRGGGVSEVGRLNFNREAWTVKKYPELGLSLWESESFSRDVEPGTYRIEISTPKNEGKYLIEFGSGEDTEGYFASLAGVRTLQKFYGYSIVKMLTSSLVYYPLGILFVLFLLQRTWKYRRFITKKHVVS